MKKIREKNVRLELTRRDLKRLLEIIILHEVLQNSLGNQKSKQDTGLTKMVKSYFSGEEEKAAKAKADDLLEEYLNWEDSEELSYILEREKDAFLTVLQENQNQGLSLSVDDIFKRVNQMMQQDGVIRLVIHRKKHDD